MLKSDQAQSFPGFHVSKDYSRLRRLLQSVGFNEAGVCAAIDIKSLAGISGENIPLLLLRIQQATPLNTLIRLFLIGVPCNAAAVQQAIQPMDLETWETAGLIKKGETGMMPAVKLLPFKNIVLTFDLPDILLGDLRDQYVMGIGRSTLTLMNLTIRQHSKATLDLGAGCGTHALLAAAHSDKVVALDLNQRAVRFANFNARLNNLSHVECVSGDLFTPVQDRSFDLVLSNPPFVISPESRYIYRDGGMSGDQLTRKIASQVPRYLNEGGYCQILCNWAELGDKDWHERLRGWFVDSGCDVWVMRSESLDAATYASTWIQHTEKAENETYSRRFADWLAYYESLGITSMGAGLITMRKTSGARNWFRADEAPPEMLGPCGEFVVRGFKLRDFLESVQNDEAFLDTRLKLCTDVRLERHATPSDQGWINEVIRLRLSKGLAYSANTDPFIANLVIQCNGKRQLRGLMAEMAKELTRPVAEIVGPFCSVVRQLVAQGFLLPENIS